MTAERMLSERGMAGWILLLSALLTFAGIMLWTGRNMWAWPISRASSYLAWERALVASGIVAAIVGFALFEGLLRAGGDVVAARIGLVLLFVGGALGVAAEAEEISRGTWTTALIAFYVVLFLLGQAAFGISILATGLLAGWVGWFTIVWNLGFLVALPIFSPGDLYYPAIHMVAPLVIGIALLAG